MSDEREALSEREKEIVRLVATGASNKEIGAALDISANTVKVHLRNVFAKMGVRSRTEATIAALEMGLVQPGGAAAGAQPAIGAEISTSLKAIPEPVSWWQKLVLLVAITAAAIITLWPSGQWPATRPVMADPLTDVPTSSGQAASGDDILRWQEMAQMPIARARFAAALIGNTIVVVGGDANGGITSAVDVYDAETNTWRLGSAKPTPVSNASAAVLGGLVYVPGGYTADGRVISTVEVYDPISDRWQTGPSLPTPLCAYALASDGVRLFLAGGWDGRQYVSKVYVLEAGASEWSPISDIPRARGHAAAVTLKGKLYIVGGFDGLQVMNRVDIYDYAQDQGSWGVGPSLLEARAGLALVTVGDTVFAIGGGWARSLAFGERLTRGASVWEKWETPLTGSWRNLGAVANDTTIYAMGGWNDGLLPDLFRYQAVYRIMLPLTGQKAAQ